MNYDFTFRLIANIIIIAFQAERNVVQCVV